MTVPGYPVAGTHTAYFGGVVYKLPLLAENDFLPDLTAIPADVVARAKLLVLTHFSQRYQSVKPFIEEANRIHDNVVAAKDGRRIPIEKRKTPS